MIRGTLAIFSMVATILFPWPFTVLLTLAASLLEPLLPLAVGLFADTLYYSPQAGGIPVFTLYGAVATVLATFVRSRLKAGIIG